MPIFEYECVECKTVEEHIVKKVDDTVECPKCGKPLKKLFPNQFNFQLKGSGWYKTGGY